MAYVFVHMARALDVLHEVDAVSLQRAMDALQHAQRPCLVVHGVERGDAVEGARLCRRVEVAQVSDDEVDVVETLPGGLRARVADRLIREVDASEPAGGKQRGESVQDPAAAAADVE